MAVSPLVVAMGAGAVAGASFAVLQERDRRQRLARMRAADSREQAMLAQAGASASLLPPEDFPPVWVLLVHVSEAKLSEKLLAKHLKVVVKYGDCGWSLRRETREVWSTDAHDGQGPSAAFNETCVFLLRRGIAPVLRFRLVKRGRTSLWRLAAKQDVGLALEPNTPYFHELLWKLFNFSGLQAGRLGSVRIVIEVRPFALSELCAYGVNVGHVMPKVGLGDVARQPSMPLLQGEAVRASPEVVFAQQEAQERAQRLREEVPGPDPESPEESDSMAEAVESVDGSSSASGDDTSEAENSSADEQRRSSLCPGFFHCPHH